MCILAAALIHVAALLLLDIVDSGKGSARPRPAEIAVLFSGTAEYQKIFEWLNANDPSLLSPVEGSNPNLDKILAVTYRPTFDSATLHLLPAAPVQNFKFSADVILPQDIISTTAADDTITPFLQPSRPSSVEFQGELAHQQSEDKLPSSLPDAPTSAEPTVVLAGALPDGKIGFVFPQKGSGSVELDRQAIEYLHHLQLKESDSRKVRWGRIIFHWGVNSDQKP